MKTVIVILMSMCASILSLGQNQIYTGGAGDGWNFGSYQQLENNIFSGGSGDGWSLQNHTQLESNIFSGGIGDGWAYKGATLQFVVSVVENKFGSSFTAWPNPTNGELNIDLGDFYQNVNVEVFNVSGQSISKINHTSISKLTIEINEESGVYYIQLTSSTNKAVIKVIKQ